MEKQEYPMIDAVRTGRRLKEVCESKNISARDLQEIMHLASVQAVYNWFKGERLPNIDNLFAFSRLLGVPLDDLLVAKVSRDIHRVSDRKGTEPRKQHLLLYWK